MQNWQTCSILKLFIMTLDHVILQKNMLFVFFQTGKNKCPWYSIRSHVLRSLTDTKQWYYLAAYRKKMTMDDRQSCQPPTYIKDTKQFFRLLLISGLFSFSNSEFSSLYTWVVTLKNLNNYIEDTHKHLNITACWSTNGQTTLFNVAFDLVNTDSPVTHKVNYWFQDIGIFQLRTIIGHKTGNIWFKYVKLGKLDNFQCKNCSTEVAAEIKHF